MVDISLASMLGRPDLAPGYGVYAVDTSGGPPSAGAPMFQANSNVSGSVSVGQLSLGMIAAGVVGLMIFYAWTRGVQK